MARKGDSEEAAVGEAARRSKRAAEGPVCDTSRPGMRVGRSRERCSDNGMERSVPPAVGSEAIDRLRGGGAPGAEVPRSLDSGCAGALSLGMTLLSDVAGVLEGIPEEPPDVPPTMVDEVGRADVDEALTLRGSRRALGSVKTGEPKALSVNVGTCEGGKEI